MGIEASMAVNRVSEDTGASIRRRSVVWADPKTAARAGAALSGLDALHAIQRGDLPPPPMIVLLGIDLVIIEVGTVTMRMPIGEYLYNPLGSVHGGAIATLVDTVMGCAIHSTLPLGRGYTTLEIKCNFLRALTDRVAEVTAVGRVVHGGRQQAVAEAQVTDAAGRLYATATTTCLVFDHPPR